MRYVALLLEGMEQISIVSSSSGNIMFMLCVWLTVARASYSVEPSHLHDNMCLLDIMFHMHLCPISLINQCLSLEDNQRKPVSWKHLPCVRALLPHTFHHHCICTLFAQHSLPPSPRGLLWAVTLILPKSVLRWSTTTALSQSRLTVSLNSCTKLLFATGT